MAPQAGDRIGAYEIVSPIRRRWHGRGLSSARDTKLNRTVAIKALQPSVAADPERIARSSARRNSSRRCSIRTSPESTDSSRPAARHYLVLEFVDGRPLDAVIRETRRAAGCPTPWTIARQIADAIAAAHEKGIIHRDLKPGNVMVTADGHVKVLDFGLGKVARRRTAGAGESAAANSPTITLGATQAGMILGTAGYMSPEQAKGRAADRRSDVWSFGCLLFELLAGSRAFEGEDVTDTIAAIVRGEPNWKALPRRRRRRCGRSSNAAWSKTGPSGCRHVGRAVRPERAEPFSVRRQRSPPRTTGRAPVRSHRDCRWCDSWRRSVDRCDRVAIGIAYWIARRARRRPRPALWLASPIVLPDGDEVADHQHGAARASRPNGSDVGLRR